MPEFALTMRTQVGEDGARFASASVGEGLSDEFTDHIRAREVAGLRPLRKSRSNSHSRVEAGTNNNTPRFQ